MATIRVDTSSLLNWARMVGTQAPRKSKASIARSLNTLGDNVVLTLTRSLARDTGLSEGTVAGLLQVRRANPNNLRIEIDASEVNRRAKDRLSTEPFDMDRGDFAQDELVIVKTMEDEIVCEECSFIAKNSPYPYAEARALIPHHPHCRCRLEKFQPTKRRVAVNVGTEAKEKMTVTQIGRLVADEMRVVLKARV